jgi:hypothetical protein
MTTQSAREKLVEEIAIEIGDGFEADFASVDLAELILSLIAERLADVTPEMRHTCKTALKRYIESLSEAEKNAIPKRRAGGYHISEGCKATIRFRAMLSASALGNGGKGK